MASCTCEAPGHHREDKLEIVDSVPAIIVSHESADDFPDGGSRAWFIVLGAACATFSTFGFVNAWGVFQAYYERTLLSNTSPSAIAWIGSIQYSLVFMPGLVTGRLFDIGYFRLPLFISSILLVVATILTAECKKYWQFLLCQGVVVGLACGVIFGPITAIVSHWFKAKRSLALGIMGIGSSAGGTVLPIAARKLIERVGFPLAMRILACILLFILSISNLTLRRRLPPSKATEAFVSWKSFKNPAFNVYCVAGFVGFLGIYTVLTYIDISSVSMGFQEDFSFYLIAIVNAASGCGRLVSGFSADKLGVLNIVIPLTFLTGVLTYVWPFVTTSGGLVAIAVSYGFASGPFISLIAAPIIMMGEAGDIGHRVGLAFTIFSIGALSGPPISGAINDATAGFKVVGIYAGSCVVLCVMLLVLTRYLVLGKWWGKF